MANTTHISRFTGFAGRCSICGAMIFEDNYCFLAGTGLDYLGNSYITKEDFENAVLFCTMDCVETSYAQQEVAG